MEQPEFMRSLRFCLLDIHADGGNDRDALHDKLIRRDGTPREVDQVVEHAEQIHAEQRAV